MNIFNILDIVEIDEVEFSISESYQSENATFDEHSIQVIGTYDNDNLDALFSSDNLIFGNRGKAIAKDDIANHNHSLMFINTSDFEFYQKIYEDNPNPKTRIKFSYNENSYDLPVTDPDFLDEYQSNLNLANDSNTVSITLSIGIEHNGWYYKLVAGIVMF
ncbi:hypothetical protein FACS1894123_06970 [Bacteroidia bacterium]|nr:hypothetical protein FACS1894123_06970 [Bacteroidia bacterium]